MEQAQVKEKQRFWSVCVLTAGLMHQSFGISCKYVSMHVAVRQEAHQILSSAAVLHTCWWSSDHSCTKPVFRYPSNNDIGKHHRVLEQQTLRKPESGA